MYDIISKKLAIIVLTKTKSIPADVGEYIAIDDNIPSGLVWIKQPSSFHKRMIGKPAGSLNKNGYYQVGFKGKLYRCHRVIHYLLTGEDPGDKQIDHREDKFNIATNLRPATNQQNQFNKKSLGNFSSKYKGIHWHKQRKKWRAAIKLNGKAKHLGYYYNELDAAYAYNIAAKLLFSEYARLNELPNDYNKNLFEHRDKVIKKANELLASF